MTSWLAAGVARLYCLMIGGHLVCQCFYCVFGLFGLIEEWHENGITHEFLPKGLRKNGRSLLHRLHMGFQNRPGLGSIYCSLAVAWRPQVMAEAVNWNLRWKKGIATFEILAKPLSHWASKGLQRCFWRGIYVYTYIYKCISISLFRIIFERIFCSVASVFVLWIFSSPSRIHRTTASPSRFQPGNCDVKQRGKRRLRLLLRWICWMRQFHASWLG